MDVSKIKIGNTVYSIKDEKARKDIEAAKISFSNLQDACTALGITAKSYTTEEFVKAMPFNSYVQFTHASNDTIKITDMPINQGAVEFQKGRTVNFCRGTAVLTTSGSVHLYKYGSLTSTNGWRTVLDSGNYMTYTGVDEAGTWKPTARATGSNAPSVTGTGQYRRHGHFVYITCSVINTSPYTLTYIDGCPYSFRYGGNIANASFVFATSGTDQSPIMPAVISDAGKIEYNLKPGASVTLFGWVRID